MTSPQGGLCSSSLGKGAVHAVGEVSLWRLSSLYALGARSGGDSLAQKQLLPVSCARGALST